MGIEGAGDTEPGDLVERLWQELLEKDDRTSPAEYPDMALITFDEFGGAQAAAVRAFTNGVLHGDTEHRDWLIAASDAFIAGQPLPPPNGKGRAEAAEQRVAALEGALRMHVAYEAMPADRGGKDGPKGRAWAAFISARDAALRPAEMGEPTQ